MRSVLETLDATIGFSANFGIFNILGLTHETYCSPISKWKTTCPGVGGKAQLAILDLQSMRSVLETLDATIGFSAKFGIFIYLVWLMKLTAALFPNKKWHAQELVGKAQLVILDLRTLLFWCCLCLSKNGSPPDSPPSLHHPDILVHPIVPNFSLFSSSLPTLILQTQTHLYNDFFC